VATLQFWQSPNCRIVADPAAVRPSAILSGPRPDTIDKRFQTQSMTSMTLRSSILLGLALATATGGFALAQQEWLRENYRGRYGGYRMRHIDTNLEPMWPENSAFRHDVFTFARVRYTSARDVWGQPQWSVDYPDSDMNLSYRLKELTSLEVNPVPVIVDLDSDEIFEYPFLYLIEPGQMQLTDAEIGHFRQYTDRGGFVMIDDFWGEQEWAVFESEMARVFPEREIIDLPLEHEIFNLVYQLREKPMIPSIGHFRMGYDSDRWDAQEAHYRAILDDAGRIMVMICHNTDLGDGWEREGEMTEYFEMYSERYAYPLGINIVMYAMTH
jgi:hypothetical protein